MDGENTIYELTTKRDNKIYSLYFYISIVYHQITHIKEAMADLGPQREGGKIF